MFSEMGGMHKSKCDGGCLDGSAARVASSSSAVEVPEEVRRTTAL